MGYCERPSLALSSLAGAGGTPYANLVVCALVVCVVLRARVGRLRFVRAGRLCKYAGPPALTLGVPTRSGVGALVFAWGRTC